MKYCPHCGSRMAGRGSWWSRLLGWLPSPDPNLRVDRGYQPVADGPFDPSRAKLPRGGSAIVEPGDDVPPSVVEPSCKVDRW